MCKPFSEGASDDDAVLEALTDKDMFSFGRKFRTPRINREMRLTLKWMDREGALDVPN